MPQPPPPIRLCCVAPKAYPLFNPDIDAPFGGAEVDLYYLATELAQDPAFAVSFIVADYGQPPREQRQAVDIIRSLDFQHSTLRSVRRLWRAFTLADAHIYLIKTASPGVPLLAWFCRRNSRSFVYRTAHQYECDGSYHRSHPLIGRAFDHALRHAQLILAQNDANAQQLRDRIGLESVVIPNGHRLAPLQSSTRDTILWVGRSAPFKQPERFIELARLRPDLHFTMICPAATDDRHYDQLRHNAQQLPNLSFLPGVPFHAIESYFLRARLFVNTSRAEGFPNTFIQACIAATPILSLNVNPDSFLDHHHCGRCADNDWPRFLTLLDQLLDPATAAALGQEMMP